MESELNGGSSSLHGSRAEISLADSNGLHISIECANGSANRLYKQVHLGIHAAIRTYWYGKYATT